MYKDFSKYLIFQVILYDLTKIKKRKVDSSEDWISLVKSLCISIGNLVDEETVINSSYKTNPELTKLYNKYKEKYHFLKYLRNKFVGHLSNDLIEKTIEWKGELRFIRSSWFLNLCILETAINSYVKDQDGEHKIFDTETDLIYLADEIRFKAYIDSTLDSAIIFIERLLENFNIDDEMIDIVNDEKSLKDYAKLSAQTQFKYITNKKKR